jgi:hypothetical protein
MNTGPCSLALTKMPPGHVTLTAGIPFPAPTVAGPVSPLVDSAQAAARDKAATAATVVGVRIFYRPLSLARCCVGASGAG